MGSITKACAKVNLHLEVLNKRADGFHNIFSVMASIDVCDLLKLDSLHVVEGDDVPRADVVAAGGVYHDGLCSIPAGSNLVDLAVREYFSGTGKTGSAIISVEKNIPMGAGLGGGSSDAAAVLRLLNDELGYYGPEGLRTVAARIGSDVPFCINGGVSLCEGRGEIIEPVEHGLQGVVLVINDGVHVNTGRAYGLLGRNEKGAGFVSSEKKQRFRDAIKGKNWKTLGALFCNDFEKPVFKENQEIYEVKRQIMQYDPEYCSMTGSGSTVIAVFNDIYKANIATRELRDTFSHVTCAEFISSSY